MTDKKLIVRRSQAKRRAAFKASGKCIQCGSEPLPGKTLCEKCRARQAAAQKRYHERKKYA